MMNRFACAALLLLTPLLSHSQEDAALGIRGHALSWFEPMAVTDSLKTLLIKSEGYNKVNILCELSYSKIKAGNTKQDYIRYLEEAWHLSEELDYNHGRAMTLFIRAEHAFNENSDTIGSLRTLQHAESFIDQTTHWSLRFRVWSLIWHRFTMIGEKDSALLYMHKPLQYLDTDLAWYPHLLSHLVLMRHASLNNNHKEAWHHLEQMQHLLRTHDKYVVFNRLRLLNIGEEVSINLENYGEYRDAIRLMMEILEKLDTLRQISAYTEFYTGKILGRIGRNYSHWGKNDSAIVYFDRAIRHFNKFPTGQFAGIENLEQAPTARLWLINAANQLEERAVVLIATGELVRAGVDLLQSKRIRIEQCDPLGVAMCYEKLGELNALRGRFLEALDWFHRSLAIKDSLLTHRSSRFESDAKFVLFSNQNFASVYLKMGRLYKEWNNMQLALDYYRQSLQISRMTGFQRCEAEALSAVGDIYLELNEQDSTLTYYNNALNANTILGYRPGISEVYESLGDFYNKQGLTMVALNHYAYAQAIFEELEMTTNVARVLIKQGELMLKTEDIKTARAMLQEGLEISNMLDLPQLKMRAHLGLSDLFVFEKNFEMAYLHILKYQEMKDILFSRETERHLADINARYEMEQNRQKVLLLESEKELIQERALRSRAILIASVTIMIILLFLAFLYNRQNSLKRSQELMMIQLRLFRSQMNPHFIFNSLGCIQSSIMNEKPGNAVLYLSRFSKLMRNILDSSESEQVTLAKELSTIENYLAIQKARFPMEFDYQICLAEDLDTDLIEVPPMLLQPFLENAIEHGIRHLDKKGKIQIACKLKNDMLTIEIEDNGVGRTMSESLHAADSSEHLSMATEITRKRIHLLKRQSGKNIHFDIIDLLNSTGNASGTKVVFGLPQ